MTSRTPSLPRFRVDDGQAEGHRWRLSQRCYWCALPVRYVVESVPDQATREHIKPRSVGGASGNQHRNIVVACRRCNQARGTDTRWLPFHIVEKHPRFDPKRGQVYALCPRTDCGIYCTRCGGLAVEIVPVPPRPRREAAS